MKEHVNPYNALLAANYLLNLDINEVKQQHQKSVAPFVIELKVAQSDYWLSQLEQKPEKHELLNKIAENVKHVLPMLKEESRYKLIRFILMK